MIVLLDLDGTLVDSADGIISCLRDALENTGHDAPPADELRWVVGPPMGDTLTTLGVSGEAHAAALTAYLEAYDDHGWTQSHLYDGVTEMLDELRAAGARLVLATSKREPIAKRVVDGAGVGSALTAVVGAAVDGSRTSKADVIAEALRRVGVTSEEGGEEREEREEGKERKEIVMVGDRIHDIEGAAAHGIPSIAVAWGYGTDDERARATTVADTPAEVAMLAQRLTAAKPVTVTFVCTGNICRSPMARVIAEHALDEAGLGDAVRVISSGLGGWHRGDPMDPRAAAELASQGYSTEHVARQVDESDLDADLLVALDTGHADELRRMVSERHGAQAAERVRLLRSFDPSVSDVSEARLETTELSVADPYYGGDDGFVTTREQIEAAMPGIIHSIRGLLGGVRA